jgi:hypothetical protein
MTGLWIGAFGCRHTPLEKAIMDAREHLDRLSAAKISPLNPKGPADPCAKIHAYDYDTVRERTIAAKRAICDRQHEKEYAPLCAYAEARLPEFEPERDAVCFPEREVLVTATTFDRIYTGIERMFDSLTRAASHPVLNLRFESDPPGASITLRAARGKPWTRSVTTDGDVPNVTRGLYECVVEKPGRKSFQRELDLVEEEVRLISCSLADVEGPDQTTCRLLRRP